MALDLTDYSGNTNDINVNSGVAEHTATEAFTGSGSSADFTTTDYMTAPDHASLNIGGTASVTLEAWVKIGASVADGDYNVISKMGADFKSNYRLIIRVTAGVCYGFFQYFDANNDWNNYNASTGGVARGEWHHYAMRYTGGTAASVKIYVDGAGVTGSWTYSNGADQLLAQTDPLYLGAMGANDMIGQVDEIRIWRAYRSDSEIANNYNIHLAGNEAGLEAYYPFQDITPVVPSTGGTIVNKRLSMINVQSLRKL